MEYNSKKNICFPAIIIILLVTHPFSFSQTGSESIHAKAVSYFNTGDIPQGKKLFKEVIDNVSRPGNEEAEAGLWLELAKLIEPDDTTGITRQYCFEKMISLYKKDGNEEKEIETFKWIADMHLVTGKLDLAETELLNVLQRFKAIRYPNLHYTYDLLAVTYRYKGDFSKGLFYALKTMESVEATHDTTYILTYYSRLANIYRELGEHEKSVQWYRKLIRVPEFTDGSNIYIFRDAGFLTRELIKLKRENEALAFILEINAKNKPIGVHATASLLASLAYCYHAMKQDQQADKYYLELTKLSEQLQKNNEVTTDVHYEIGQYFMDKLQYGIAAAHFQKALNAADGTNSLSVTKDIYMMLYKSDSAMGNYLSAMQHLMRHKILSDSIFNVTKSRQIEELQVQYETAKKEKYIAALNSQNQLQRIRTEQVNRTKNITLAGVALLMVIIGLLLNRYLMKQRSNRKLEAHQRELDQKNFFLETLNTEQDKLLKEKEWLIREVHHRVKNNLQMVTSLLNTQSAYLHDDAAVLAVKDSLRRMQAMSLIHQKLYQSENISTIAMPQYINELVSYLHDSLDTSTRIVFEQTIEPLDLDVAQAIPLGLIINECIVNAIKYAFPDEQKGTVSIILRHSGADHLLLNISDNGIGLPPGLDIMEHNSLGLNLVQGLTKQLNGSFNIESNGGVHIMIRFVTLNK